MKLDQIGQIAIVVHDVERALAFYRDTLGMRFLFKAPPGLAFFDCGGVRLMLATPEGGGTAQANSTLYYKVADIQHTFDTLSERGVTFVEKPHLVAKLPDHDLWLAFFRDSEQNLLGLMSEIRS